MITLLCLDVAGSTGWARWKEGAANPVWGVAKIAKGSRGQDYARFHDWLNAEVVLHEVTHIVIEAVYVDEKTVTAAKRLLAMFGIAEMIAYRRGVAIEPVMSMDWRQHFLGQRSAPKTVPAKKRREWWKKQAVDEARRRGWNVKVDDEAEALGLLTYMRAKLLPAYGLEGDLLSLTTSAVPLGMERVS